MGWDRLRAYLDPPQPNPAIEAIRMFVEDVRVKQIAPDLAIGIWNWHFEMKVIASHPIGEDVRVSGVFRKTDDGWRYIHYAESPKTAAVYLEDLTEKDVRPGWDEFYDRRSSASARSGSASGRRRDVRQDSLGSHPRGAPDITRTVLTLCKARSETRSPVRV